MGMMKIKTKAIPMVMVVLIGFCIFAPIVCAETAEEWIERGISFGLSGEHEKAIECFNKAIELNSNLAEAYYNRGISYYNLKQYERVIEDYNKAIELNPDYAEAYHNRGLAYKDLGQYERAIEDFNKTIELNPNYAKTYYNRALTYYDLKQYERAIEDYNKAIELNPNYANAYINRGAAYGDLKQYERAIEDYNKTIELNPNYALAYNNRGVAYGDLKQYEKAIEDFNKAIELNPNYANAYYNRALTYSDLKQYERAIEDFNKAIELNPNYATNAYHNREFVLSKLKEQKHTQISTPTLIGTWVGNASLDGEVIGEVRFNCFEDKIVDFTISLKEFPFNIIDEVTGKKIGSGTAGNGTAKSFNSRYSPIGNWITTITNNQFFLTSSVQHLVKNDFLGVFTSNNNATGTWQYVKRGTGSEILVSPPIAWKATKVTEILSLTPTPSPTTTPVSPTPTSLPPTTSLPATSPTATAKKIPTSEEKGVPGFEAIFAITGLLAMAYLLRRRK
jgi:PGF-CTERM protein